MWTCEGDSNHCDKEEGELDGCFVKEYRCCLTSDATQKNCICFSNSIKHDRAEREGAGIKADVTECNGLTTNNVCDQQRAILRAFCNHRQISQIPGDVEEFESELKYQNDSLLTHIPYKTEASHLSRKVHEECESEIYEERYSRTGHTLSRACFGGGTEFLVLIGGFGPVHGKHQRLKQVTAIEISPRLDCSEQSWTNQATSTLLGTHNVLTSFDVQTVDGVDVFYERMFHTATNIDNRRILLFGGRTSPVNGFSEVSLLELTREELGFVQISKLNVESDQQNGAVNCLATLDDGAAKRTYSYEASNCRTSVSLALYADVHKSNERGLNSAVDLSRRTDLARNEQCPSREATVETKGFIEPASVQRSSGSNLSIHASLRAVQTAGGVLAHAGAIQRPSSVQANLWGIPVREVCGRG